MITVIDNYDSFTFNLVQYLWELGAEVQVYRNDEKSVPEVLAESPERILISPGPCTPTEAGISVDLIKAVAERGVPLMGVCLGHQSIGQAFGGAVERAEVLMHGKTSLVEHNNTGLFAGLPSPFTATRYHSLVVNESLPDCLETTAWTVPDEASSHGGRVLMGIQHKTLPIAGVQFHPESFLTEHGHDLLRNFLEMSA